MTIWSSLGHFLYFMAIWYSLWSFGIFFPFWYIWTKKNLAALVQQTSDLMNSLFPRTVTKLSILSSKKWAKFFDRKLIFGF
jgi:hypothetical protein